MEWKLVSAHQFDKIATQWDDLNSKSQNLAILNSRFISAAVKYFLTGDEILALGYKQGQLHAAGFFHAVGFAQWASVMPSQAPVALWQSYEHRLSDELVRSLAKALPDLVLTIDFLQIDSRSFTLESIHTFEVTPYIETGNLPIPENFDNYFASLGKNMRQNYNKVINRAAKEGDELSAERISDANQILEAIEEYSRLESKGWKSKGDTAVSLDNKQGKFYLDMMSALAKYNQACCWYYKINQQVVAVDLCVMQNHTLIILKTTYDEDFSKQSPGLHLKIEMLRHYSTQSSDIRYIEFYGRVMQWHQRLNSQVRELQHISWYKNRWVRSLKRIVKQIKALQRPE